MSTWFEKVKEYFDKSWWNKYLDNNLRTDTRKIQIPTFEIASNPTIRISEMRARRFYLIDRAQIQARATAQSEEDARIFDAINRAVQEDPSVEGAIERALEMEGDTESN